MSRAARAFLALSISLLAASSAFGQQEPPQTKELKEAEKFVTSAMITRDSADRRSRLERALNPIQQAMVKDPANARVWLVAGQVYAGLADYARADSAFTKSLQLYPPFADDISSERLRAWAELFNKGVELMDERKYDEAVQKFTLAETLYSQRPEAKMNLAAIYANRGDAARAEELFRSVLELTKSPARAALKAEDAAQWDHFTEMSTINLAQMIGQRGIEAFDKKSYDEAIQAFREAHALNPMARDYTYNLAQSLYARSELVADQREDLADREKAARARKDVAAANARAQESKQLAAELLSTYNEVDPLVTRARQVDPNNLDLFLLLMRAYRVRADLTTDATAKSAFLRQADELLREHQALAAEVNEISITPGSTEAIIRGKLRNLKLQAGSAVNVQMTLLGLDGSVVGQQETVVTAPAVQESVPFEMTTKLTGEMAAWKYRVAK